MIQKIWSLPNTFVGWVTFKLKRKKYIDRIEYSLLSSTYGVKKVYTTRGISNFAPGDIVFTTEAAEEHELAHSWIARQLGWAYLSHIWYFLYSLGLLIFTGGQVAWWNLFGSVAFFFIWFLLNEYFVRKVLEE